MVTKLKKTIDSEIDFIEYEKLDLDLENPRLPEYLKKNKKIIVNHIASTTAIEDLMQAISANGFFSGEPLIAIKSGDRYTVLEGNRRLTAVMILNDPSILSKPSKKILDIVSATQSPPKKLPVVVKQTRAEVLPYLGFRHITGVKQWEPLAKARYIKSLYDLLDKNLTPSVRYAEVAKNIGSRKDHIRRNLDALSVYRVICDEDFYGIDDLNEDSLHFAVLSTAIADERLGKFIGTLRETKEGLVNSDPIENNKFINKANVMEITKWIFEKNSEGETRVGESRNLKYLSLIVDTPKALEAFRDGATLSYAYRLTKGANEELRDMLYEVETIISRAASIVAHVDYDADSFDLVKQIRDNVVLIGKTLKSKLESDDGF